MLVELGKRTWPEVRDLCARERVLGLVALGSLEQHGPHLPLSTDALLAEELVRRIGSAIAEPVLAAPVVHVTLSAHHLAFPGTATIDERALEAIVDAHVEALQRAGVAAVAAFSAHGGNFDFLSRYERPGLSTYGDLQRYIETGLAGSGLELPASDAHAGGMETSQMLEAYPDLVRPFRDVEGYAAAEEGWQERLWAEGIDALSPNGVLGDPRPATSAAGAGATAAIRDELVRWICDDLGFTRA
jgi:creatinine amidohydrolase